MSDGILIPISDEQAKLLRDGIGAVRATGSYLADLAGDLPKDLVAGLLGDRVKRWRAERLAKGWAKTLERLEAEGIRDPQPPSLKIAIPLLEGMADESNDDLHDIWSRLLAMAMHPGRSRLYRQRFAEVARELDPLDALSLRSIRLGGVSVQAFNEHAQALSISRDELGASLDNLARIGLAVFYDSRAYAATPLGREFLRAVSEKPD